MAPLHSKKRALEEGMKGHVATHPAKKPRKQRTYSSSSSSPPSAKNDHFAPVNLADSDAEEDVNQDRATKSTNAKSHSIYQDEQEDSDSINDSNSDSGSLTSTSDRENENPNITKRGPKSKRHDPSTFSTSLSKILSTKLTTTQRSDPVLARSKDAITASKEISEGKLELKARRKLREDKKKALEKGRVKDVLIGSATIATAPAAAIGTESAEESTISTAAVTEQERRLRKTAQRGVVKLFNAVRVAQVKGEEAARESRRTGSGVVGRGAREEKVGEMSKKGFLDLVAGGGGGKGGGTQTVKGPKSGKGTAVVEA